MTLDNIIRFWKEDLKEIITEYELELNNNNFEIIYENFDDIDLKSAFTALLLKNNINPLYHMNYVPSSFAANLDIENIIIPNSINYMEQCAFEDCIHLKSITIPKSLTYIPSYNFDGCNNLTDIFYEGSEEDWKKIKIEDGNEELLKANIHYNS